MRLIAKSFAEGARSRRQLRPAAASSAAECLEDAFGFSWRIGVAFETLLVLNTVATGPSGVQRTAQNPLA